MSGDAPAAAVSSTQRQPFGRDFGPTLGLMAFTVVAWGLGSALLFYGFTLVGTGCNGVSGCGPVRGVEGEQVSILVAGIVVALGVAGAIIRLALRRSAWWIPLIVLLVSAIALFVGAGWYLTHHAS